MTRWDLPEPTYTLLPCSNRVWLRLLLQQTSNPPVPRSTENCVVRKRSDTIIIITTTTRREQKKNTEREGGRGDTLRLRSRGSRRLPAPLPSSRSILPWSGLQQVTTLHVVSSGSLLCTIDDGRFVWDLDRLWSVC